MVTVKEQYEAYPYPERDPEDERKRLITGSPSHPVEVDHFLFGGKRDWSKPFRALVAGGGTGDGLIQLATILSDLRVPHQITYLDLSTQARGIAEARAKVRGLTSITFHTASLLEAPDHGPFDYIDCCGVLHHLPDPVAGLQALRRALAPGGGMGIMVYAPYGRSGVYPLQEAFGDLFEGLSPQDRLQKAKALVDTLPTGHPFAANTNLGDHKRSDAGFYDLLLHGQDRAYAVPDFLEFLDRGGCRLVSFTMPGLYNLARITTVPDGMPPDRQMAVAERLRGTIKMHVAYVVPADDDRLAASGTDRSLVPHLKGIAPQDLAQAAMQGETIEIEADGVIARLELRRDAGPLLALINGRHTVNRIALRSRMDAASFDAAWTAIEQTLTDWGLLLYTSLGR